MPKKQEVEMAVMHSKLETIDNNVSKLIKVIMEGNGKPSLLSRVDTNERLTKHVPDLLTDSNKAKGERNAVKIIGSIISIVLAFASVVIAVKVW